MPLKLEIRDVSFRYQGIGASDRSVLSRVSLEFSRLGCTAIVGPSGSGKTTLIQQFTGLLRPGAGSVLVDGDDIWGKRFARTRLRRRIGLVFQFPETQLFEETVFEDVAFAPANQGLEKEQIRQRVDEALRSVGLQPDDFISRSPFQLSEGEKRRVAIAGVLAMKPELLVLDEPTAGLDASGIKEIADIVEHLQHEGTAVIVVTHNMDFVNDIADRVVALRLGSVLFDGPTAELFADAEILKQADLTLPHFLRLKDHWRRDWPPQWRQIASLRQLIKIAAVGHLKH
jgi:energy-coupling factor transport system ATP-binding protein